MLLSVTEAAKVAGCARSTIYEKINAGQLSRSAGGKIDTAELHRVFGELQTPAQQQPNDTPDKSDTMASELLDMVQTKDLELAQVRAELDETKARLTEHREAARALIDPKTFEAKQAEWQQKLQQQRTDQQRKESEWKQTINDRKLEIQQARAEADEIRLREADQAKALKAECDRVVALESRGIIARLMNKKPSPVV
ncbi:MAG: hypothetical protein V3U76_00035 [Granulosicoccus sp.]